jgi:hypothetical protein
MVDAVLRLDYALSIFTERNKPLMRNFDHDSLLFNARLAVVVVVVDVVVGVAYRDAP